MHSKRIVSVKGPALCQSLNFRVLTDSVLITLLRIYDNLPSVLLRFKFNEIMNGLYVVLK